MIGILLFESFHGKLDIGSSRIRGHYLIKYWPELKRFVLGRHYDAMIYQKAYWVEHAEAFDGIKILDLCDPDFRSWGYPTKRMIDAVDGITCSSPALAEAVAQFAGGKPVAVIADRFDLDTIPKDKKVHTDERTNSVAWYGYPQNYPLLDSAVPALARVGIKKLIVISNGKKMYQLPVGMHGKIDLEFINYDTSTYMDDFMLADVVLNPRARNGNWRYKSDNKTTLARLCGMPVAHDSDELNALMTPEARRAESAKWFDYTIREFDVRKSVDEMKEFIEICRAEKANRK